ncbi:transposase [Bdellovibrionota bacterium FG-2]
MSQPIEVNRTKKTRTRRSPEMIAELIWEAERKGNTAEVCRRENVAPTLFYRWKQKFKEGGIQNLQAMKRGPKARDHEKKKLEREVARLAAALCESAIELQLLKKSVNSD